MKKFGIGIFGLNQTPTEMKPVLLFAVLLFVGQSCRKHEDRCRLVRTESDDLKVLYIYNDDDQLTTMRIEPKNDSAVVSEWQYFYDTRGRLDSSSQIHLIDNSYPRVFAYEYDKNGQMAVVKKYNSLSFIPGHRISFSTYHIVYEDGRMAGYLTHNSDGTKYGEVWSDFKNGRYHKSSDILRGVDGKDKVYSIETFEYDDCVNPRQKQIALYGFPNAWLSAPNNMTSHTIQTSKTRTYDVDYKYKRKLPCEHIFIMEDGEKTVTEYFYEFY